MRSNADTRVEPDNIERISTQRTSGCIRVRLIPVPPTPTPAQRRSDL
jgi:hypothetical protein